jgi:hypothetical protein
VCRRNWEGGFAARNSEDYRQRRKGATVNCGLQEVAARLAPGGGEDTSTDELAKFEAADDKPRA